MILKGNNVILRYPSPGDAELMMQWENDPDVWEVGDNKEPYSFKEISDYIAEGEDIIANKQLRLMICKIKNERPVGCIDLYEYDLENERAGIGILIYDKKDRKKGMAFESLELIINYSRNNLNLKQLFCYILEDNDASIRLFRKMGFETTGMKKHWRRLGESWKNEIIMQLLLR